MDNLECPESGFFNDNCRKTQEMDYIGYIYACLLAIGGLAGYLKAGSLMSLLMGTLTGLGAGVGAYRASANPGDVYIGLVVSILVAARSVKQERRQ